MKPTKYTLAIAHETYYGSQIINYRAMWTIAGEQHTTTNVSPSQALRADLGAYFWLKFISLLRAFSNTFPKYLRVGAWKINCEAHFCLGCRRFLCVLFLSKHLICLLYIKSTLSELFPVRILEQKQLESIATHIGIGLYILWAPFF